MTLFKLEVFSEKNTKWQLMQESENLETLESLINWEGENKAWRIVKENEIVGAFVFNGEYQQNTLDLGKEIKGFDLLTKLENSPYLKNRGYSIQNAHTSYPEEGMIQEIKSGERLQEVNTEKANKHDLFFECFDEEWIYLQILPFPSQEIINKISFTINSGEPLTVLKDLNAFLKEI